MSFVMGDVCIIHKQANTIQVLSIFEYPPMHSLIDIIQEHMIPARSQIRLCHVSDEVNKECSDIVTKNSNRMMIYPYHNADHFVFYKVYI